MPHSLNGGLGPDTPRNLLDKTFEKHFDKVEEYIAEHAGDDGEIENVGAKSWITRRQDAMKEITGWLNAKVKEEPTTQATTGGGNNNNDGPDMKAMVADCKTLPELNAGVHVEVFVRAANLKYDTHVKQKASLEPHFIKQIVMKLCSDFRASHNAHIQTTAITKWSEMREYLMTKHQSSTTAHQELRMVYDMRMEPNEELRNFAARLESKGNEKFCVIEAKYKRDNNGAELNAAALWQLLMGQTLIRNMQASPKYSEHYARVLVDLNGLYKVEELSKKADVLYEKEQRLDQTFHASKTDTPAPGAFSKMIDDKLNSFLSKMSTHSGSNQTQAPINNNNSGHPKKKTLAELVTDPARLAKIQEKRCFADERNEVCKKKTCHYKHINHKRTVHLSSADLNGRGPRQSPQ